MNLVVIDFKVLILPQAICIQYVLYVYGVLGVIYCRYHLVHMCIHAAVFVLNCHEAIFLHRFSVGYLGHDTAIVACITFTAPNRHRQWKSSGYHMPTMS